MSWQHWISEIIISDIGINVEFPILVILSSAIGDFIN